MATTNNPEFYAVKKLFDENVEFFNTSKIDVGYNVEDPITGRSSEIDFYYCDDDDKYTIKRRRTSPIADMLYSPEELRTSPFRKNKVSFAKTRSGSLYIQVKYIEEINSQKIFVAESAETPVNGSEIDIMLFNVSALGFIVLESNVRKETIKIEDSVNLGNNIYAVKVEDNLIFVRVNS